MRIEVMEDYALAQPIDQAGYYETAHHRIFRELFTKAG